MPSPTRARPRRRRGLALLIALVVMVVVSALAAGALFTGGIEWGSSQSVATAASAEQAAEAGMDDVIANWSSFGFNGVAPGTTATGPAGPVAPGVTYLTAVTALNDMGGGTSNLFQVTAEGRAGNARATLAQVLQIVTVDIPANAAITARGTVHVTGSATVNGFNTRPPYTANPLWASCPVPPTGTGVPAIRTSGAVTTQGNGYDIRGTPTDSVPNDPTISPTIISDAFDAYAALVPPSRIIPAASAQNPAATTVTVGGVTRCQTSNVHNWGSPNNAVPVCADYFPITYISGNVMFNGGRGQGVLLVDGNLEMRGNFEFYGIIVVKGTAQGTNGTYQVYGTLLANDLGIGTSSWSGNSNVIYSSCAIGRAQNASGYARPLTQRSWTQSYN